jgi:hypothetical protein
MNIVKPPFRSPTAQELEPQATGSQKRIISFIGGPGGGENMVNILPVSFAIAEEHIWFVSGMVGVISLLYLDVASAVALIGTKGSNPTWRLAWRFRSDFQGRL